MVKGEPSSGMSRRRLLATSCVQFFSPMEIVTLPLLPFSGWMSDDFCAGAAALQRFADLLIGRLVKGKDRLLDFHFAGSG